MDIIFFSTIIDYYLHLLVIFIISNYQFMDPKSTKFEDFYDINLKL